ncbi:MAG: hypothetical protein ACKV2T_04725 [Kofleriaceae bacterium]
MRTLLCLASVCFASACGDDGGTECSGANCLEEVITTVTLTLTPTGGAPIVAEFDDPDGDGGEPPMIDSIALLAGTTYSVTVGFQNRLETPPEEITEEVRDEATDHQVFFTGDAVNGPASDRPTAAITHAYTDTDGGGLPIGLSNQFVVGAGAAGDLIVTLRHMPPINDQPTKTANAAALVRSGGFAAIGGENDAQVTFPVAVAIP